MTTELVDIAPAVELILADLERQNFDWTGSLGELLDNPLDAAADQITVEIDKKNRRVVVTDNGTGCAEPHRMFIKGYSTKKRGAGTVGMYGVGMKHASFYLTQRMGTTTVVTGSGDLFQTVRVCWNDVVQRGEWKINAPERITREEALHYLPQGKGTCIEFTVDKARGWLTDQQFDKMLSVLAFMFSPALRAGRQIKFIRNGSRAKPLACPVEPAWSEMEQFTLEIGHRKATVRAGVLAPNDKSGRRGLSFTYAHRIVLADTQSGCGDYGTQGFAGFVDLDENWKLGQNKSQVTDEAWQQLCDQLEIRLRPLLEKVRSARQHLHIESMASALSDLLNETIRGEKPKRPGERKTTRKPTKQRRDRVVTQAAVVEGLGDILGRSIGRGGFVVDYEDRPDEDYAARVDPNGRCVYLNKSKTAIAQALQSGNFQMLGVTAAAHLFHSQAGGLIWRDKTFSDLMNKLLSRAVVMTAASAQSA